MFLNLTFISILPQRNIKWGFSCNGVCKANLNILPDCFVCVWHFVSHVNLLHPQRTQNPKYLCLNTAKLNVRTFFCYLLDVYIDFTPASSNWTTPPHPSCRAVKVVPTRMMAASVSSSYPQSSASSSVQQQQSELQSNISRLSTSSWMIKWSGSRQWCKCLIVTIKKKKKEKEIFSWIPILSLPCPFSQKIQQLKSAAEKQTLAVCASSCFMTPETVELCQTGMIL
jgi:hypothetical protein